MIILIEQNCTPQSCEEGISSQLKSNVHKHISNPETEGTSWYYFYFTVFYVA